jgi:lysozyme
MIYTGRYYWQDRLGTRDFSSSPLWHAQYTTASCPNIADQWSQWAIWQYTDTGTVPGVPGSGGVDLDRFNGTLAELTALANGNAGPIDAAAFVTQSFPYASVGELTMHAGESVSGFIELRNTGTTTWNDHTELGTTEPRDRASVFVASDWVSPNRPARVSGSVAPGTTYRFVFTLHAPDAVGRYDEHFGVVQDGSAWFSDPTEGGPPDNLLEVIVRVLPADDAGASDGAAGDAAVTGDAAAPDAGSDASAAESGHPGGGDAGVRGDGSVADGSDTAMRAGFGCNAGGITPHGRLGALGALGIAAALLRRRRRTRPSRA